MPDSSAISRKFIIAASIFGALAVAIGAFGAHSLKAYLMEAGRFDTFETAVRYHFYHTFALLAVGLLGWHVESRLLKWSGACFIVGIVLFSGSLYVLCMVSGLDFFGVITPLGGLFFIAGWLLMLFAVLRRRENKA